MNVVYILQIRRNIQVFLNDVIYRNLLLNMISVGEVSMNIDFEESGVMRLLHGALQLCIVTIQYTYERHMLTN